MYISALILIIRCWASTNKINSFFSTSLKMSQNNLILNVQSNDVGKFHQRIDGINLTENCYLLNCIYWLYCEVYRVIFQTHCIMANNCLFPSTNWAKWSADNYETIMFCMNWSTEIFTYVKAWDTASIMQRGRNYKQEHRSMTRVWTGDK